MTMDSPLTPWTDCPCRRKSGPLGYRFTCQMRGINHGNEAGTETKRDFKTGANLGVGVGRPFVVTGINYLYNACLNLKVTQPLKILTGGVQYCN